MYAHIAMDLNYFINLFCLSIRNKQIIVKLTLIILFLNIKNN